MCEISICVNFGQQSQKKQSTQKIMSLRNETTKLVKEMFSRDPNCKNVTILPIEGILFSKS